MTYTLATPSGTSPYAAVVNPATNRIYVANSTGGNVSVVDGATNALLATVPVGSFPQALGVNTTTNKIYVANAGTNNVSVIDGATNTVVGTIAVGSNPQALAINPVTNKIYVANRNSGTVTVIDGASNSAANNLTVTTGTAASSPYAVAVNPVSNKIYVANFGSNNVAVIDGATNATVNNKYVTTGSSPSALAINPATNKIYVANFNSNTVTVIDGSTNLSANNQTISVGTNPVAIAVDPVANKIYVPDRGVSPTCAIIDGSTNIASYVSIAGTASAVAVNPISQKVYVANQNAGLTVIQGTPAQSTTVAVGTGSNAIAINPVTNKIYVANGTSNNISVVDGTTYSVATGNFTYGAGPTPTDIAVNPVTGLIYVSSSGSPTVTVFDGATLVGTQVSVGGYPNALAINPVTNNIYVATGNDTYGGTARVVAINGAFNTNATNRSITFNSTTDLSHVAVDAAKNKVYVTAYDTVALASYLYEIDGSSYTSQARYQVGSTPRAIAVNPVTHKVYVVNYGSNSVTILDGNTTVTVPVGANPWDIAINPTNNKIYVTSNAGVDVINGVTNSLVNLPIGIGYKLGVNPVTNKVYVTTAGAGGVVVIDGVTSATHTIPTAIAGPVAVDSARNKIYIGSTSANSILAIDGITDTIIATSATSNPPTYIALNPLNGTVYAMNNTVVSLIRMQEAVTQPNGLGVAIAPLSGNINHGPNANFYLTSSSTAFTPVQGVYHQLDTWQGNWTRATSLGGSLQGAAWTGLQNGTHVLYAYAVDGEDSSSTNAQTGASPLVGQMAAYVFTVVPYPDVPTGVTAVAGNGQAVVNFTAPASYGDSPILSYTAYSNPANINNIGSCTGPAACAITVNGLTNGTSYTFSVLASNIAGSSALSAPSNSVIPIGPPGAPTGVTASAGNAQATITFTAPATNGGSAITGYSATSNPGNLTGTCTGAPACPIAVNNLTNGVAYTFTVTATNAAGFTSTASAASSSVTPRQSQTIGTINFTPATLSLGGTTTASATATSGLAVSFNSSVTPTICSVSGTTVTGLLAGTCTITATQAGNTSYAAAAGVAQNITVTQGSQTISAINFTPATLSVGGSTTASATTTSGLAVSFNSNVTPTNCSVSGTTVTGLLAGTCTITATQVGDANYLAAIPVTQSINVTAPAVQLTPLSLTFSDQHLGTTSLPQNVTLTNTGTASLTGIVITVSSASITPSEFSVTHGCGASLGAGLSCNLAVTYTPSTAGNHLGSVSVASNAAGSPHLVTLSGTGIAANVPICTLTAAPASIRRGGSATLTANCSPAPTSYTWTGGTCAGTNASTCHVAPGATTTYTVTGTNGSVTSSPASATVTLKSVDLTPILMLLLD